MSDETSAKTSEVRANLDLIGMGAAILGAALFSTKPVIIKLIYDEGVPPETMLLYRMLIALPFYLIIGTIAFKKRPRTATPPSNKLLLAIIANGVLGYYLASYLDFLGLQYITAQFERLILFTYPFFVVILGAMFFGQKLKPLTFPALIVAYLGLALIFWRNASLAGSDDAILGAILVLGAALSFSLFQLFGKQLIGQIGAPIYTSIAMSAAAFGVMIHFAIAMPWSALAIPMPVFWLCAVMALLATVAPSYLLNFALGRIGADGTAMVGNAGPLFTIVFAALLLGEPFGLIDAIGTGLVLAGMILFSRR